MPQPERILKCSSISASGACLQVTAVFQEVQCESEPHEKKRKKNLLLVQNNKNKVQQNSKDLLKVLRAVEQEQKKERRESRSWTKKKTNEDSWRNRLVIHFRIF